MTDHTFGARIKESRKRNKLSQKALADLCGDITRSAISQWETGVILNISAANLAAVSRVLGVSATWLLYGTRDSAGVAEPCSEYQALPASLAQAWDQLTKAQREEITAHAKSMAEANAAVLKELGRK